MNIAQHILSLVSNESMENFSDNLKLVHSISIIKPIWVYWGLFCYDLVNVKHDYLVLKNFKQMKCKTDGMMCMCDSKVHCMHWAINIIGLSFLIRMKELCEARAKLETSSNFQIYPWGVNLMIDPSVSNFHDNFTDLIFRFSCLPGHTTDWPPQYVSLSVPVHCLCNVISKDLLWTSINIYIYIYIYIYI